MVTTKTTKEVKNVTETKNLFSGKYFSAVGRRKAAIAQVRVYEMKDAKDEDFIVNNRGMKEYFPILRLQNAFLSPLKIAGMHGKVTLSILVKGGGQTGQADAIKLGIARALIKLDDALRPALKAAGLLMRDARVVERKKPGLRKARRAPQWAKR